MAKLYYLNDRQEQVFTSQYLNNRGTCCRSNCLHCPYGTTLKNCGLQFTRLSEDQLQKAQSIIDLHQGQDHDIAAMLLSSAFKQKKKKVKINLDNIIHFSFVQLKDEYCGVVYHPNVQFKEVFLGENFQNQGLSQDVVYGYWLEKDARDS